jgi:poly(ADP-ribose) glycohydrolase ARH3
MPAIPSADQFLGCLLGQAIGDGLGAPYEGLPADNIYWGYGQTGDLIQNPTEEILYYTDDTQMMIGVAETLVEHGQIREETLCQAFMTNYHPDRGYGQGARLVLEAMATGGDWRSLARGYFPGGSFGNGAAMRAAPIGLLFCDDLDRVIEQARLSALPTHVHPLGIEGAQMLAVAVALAVREAQFDKKAFYRELSRRAQSEEFRWHLSVASRLTAGDTLSVLGNSLEAHRSVVTAIACFAVSPRSYEHAISRAISLGNDTDTLAAMAGAIRGAHLGVRAIPGHLLDKLEDNHKGRTYIHQLAVRLYGIYRSRR